jgi:predicted DNA-binding transcriptional regulator AlpA
MPQSQLAPLLSKQEICAQLKISLRTIENMVKSGGFPPGVRVGKFMYWSEIAVLRWQQKRFAIQESWDS